MKPLVHARISAHRYGGHWRDYIAVHDFADLTKAHFASVQHRMLLHTDFAAALIPTILGQRAGGVPVATLMHDHIVEDLGYVATVGDWLKELDVTRLGLRRHPKSLDVVREDPTVGLTARYPGLTATQTAPVSAFFDAVDTFTDGDAKARFVLHNSLGVFLAERALGVEITAPNGRLYPTRSLAEDIVVARMGWIPSFGMVAANVRMRAWMRGSRVAQGLAARRDAQLGEVVR